MKNFLVLLCLVGTADGDDLDGARALYRDAELSFQKGDFTKAAELFEQAFARYDAPNILFDAAQSYRRLYDQSRDLAHLRKAQAHYQRFIELVPSAERAGLAAKLSAVLGQRAAEERAGALERQLGVANQFSVEFKDRIALLEHKRAYSAATTAVGVLAGVTLVAAVCTGSLALSFDKAYLTSTETTAQEELKEARHRLAVATDVLIPLGAVLTATTVTLAIVGWRIRR